LDAGDLLFKKFSQPISENERNKFAEKAYLIIESFNLMGYDALGIGDDDLSLGKEFLMQISKKANFPFLSTNVMDEESRKPLFQLFLLKEIEGLRIGIFSLLSPDIFLGPSDPRKKGLIFQSPIETAQDMVKKLQPRTDLIILLSHLSYPKDVELAQAVQGIHFIIGSHTGANLIRPALIKNTYIFQTASKGMYVGRLDLILHNNVPSFYNSSDKRQWESRLRFIKNRLLSKHISETERAQWRKAEGDTEGALEQFQGKNELTNTIFPLREGMKDHDDILKMAEEYHLKYPEKEKPASPK
jgi:2',3'-cyclic-nucleotide 2'-phosphodiesterase (5'-nucleotidase family)